LNRNFFIALLLFPFIDLAQVLLPNAFADTYPYTSELIKQKKIKRIIFDIIDKKDFEVAQDKQLIENYEFNSEGLLTKYYYTIISKIIEREITTVLRHGKQSIQKRTEYLFDTISTTYLYQNKKLILKRHCDGKEYYESRYYRYSKENMLCKELRFKETNNSKSKNLFILGNQVQLSEDSFQIQKYGPTQTKIIYLNNENRPYKEEIINYDLLGRMINSGEFYTAASWIQQEKKYTYAREGLITAELKSNANSTFSMKNKFEYDQNNELYLQQFYKNEVLQKEIHYVNDSINKLLNSFIVKIPNSKSLRIVKLSYEYWD
jgi:hypothetical protein